MPGHVGVPGNERADRLAREAAGRAATFSPVPCTDVFPAIREAIIAIWQERWDARGATSKKGEVTRTVSSMGLFQLTRTSLTNSFSLSAHLSHSPNPQLSDVR